MQHAVSRSLAAVSLATFAVFSAVAAASADDRMPPPPLPAEGSMSGSAERPAPRPEDRPESGATGSTMNTGSGAHEGRPMEQRRDEKRAPACTGSGFAGAWRGTLSLKVEKGDDYEYEGNFRLVDVGPDATEKTEDDTVYEGTFYASESEDGALELVLTSEDGLVSDYASLSRVSDNELAGTVSMDGSEIEVKSARECQKPRDDRKPREDRKPPRTGSGGMSVESDGNSVRMGADGMEVRSSDGTTVRMGRDGMEVRQEARETRREIRQALLSAALKAKIDERLAKMDEDVRHAFYPKVVERIDALVADMADGKKKGLYIELRDYLESKWYEEYPEDAVSAEDNVLDDVFSEE